MAGSLTAPRARRLWAGPPPAPALVAAASLVAALMALPLLYLVVRGVGGGPEAWARLLGTRVAPLLGTTLSLAALCTAAALAIGVPLAWLVERTDLPGRRALRWLAALPLVIPPYVGALAYITLLAPGGLAARGIGRSFGPYGVWGAAAILALFTCPYVFLLVSAALRSLSRSLEEAARGFGHDAWSVFFRVTLPLLRPAIGASALLVCLYALADFGAVVLLRVNTFTSAIYLQLAGRYDRAAAAALSVVLVALTLAVLWGEERLRGSGRYVQAAGDWRPPHAVRLGPWTAAALAFAWGVIALSLLVPLAVLGYWARQGALDRSPLAEIWRVGHAAVWTAALQSLASAGAAATAAVVLALPAAYLLARHPGAVSRALARVSQAGYALPGIVVALSMVFALNRFAPWLYGTVAAVVLAYVVRFLPQALLAAGSSLAQVSPSLEEAARGLGEGPRQTFWRVTRPLVARGLAAGWALVFLTALKELPATLVLRPAGFDPLAVRIWIPASEGLYGFAALPALVLVACSALPLVPLLARGGRAGLPGAS